MSTAAIRQLTGLFGIRVPLIQAPMAGANDAEMVIAVSEAGGLGSLPCAMLTPEQAGSQMETIRSRTDQPFNVNFFCHDESPVTKEHESRWQAALAPYYKEAGLELSAAGGARREPFSDAMCQLMEEYVPAVVSFHFGLPAESLLARVKAAGCRVISSATSVREARWLEQRGCDAVIAQGVEAGGHRGNFLNQEAMHQAVAMQTGTFSLLPQIVDAVDIPVIAAGGMADAGTVSAAFNLGAAAAQIGTAYLYCDEALISDLHRKALAETPADESALTNIFSGRPARGLMNRSMRELGPLSEATPPFPTAGAALAPLKAHFEKIGSADFSSLWAGQGYALSREYLKREFGLANPGSGVLRVSAGALTLALAKSAIPIDQAS